MTGPSDISKINHYDRRVRELVFNLFIAGDTGLGKTIEAGLIARELLLRKKAKTIVVAAPPSVLDNRSVLYQRIPKLFAELAPRPRRWPPRSSAAGARRRATAPSSTTGGSTANKFSRCPHGAQLSYVMAQSLLTSGHWPTLIDLAR